MSKRDNDDQLDPAELKRRLNNLLLAIFENKHLPIEFIDGLLEGLGADRPVPALVPVKIRE